MTQNNLQPYLTFVDCVGAIDFYSAAFGASERLLMKNDGGHVVHAEIQIGDSVVMMSDESPQMEAFSVQHYGGSPISLVIYVPDCDAVYTRAIAAGATSIREPADQPYGDRMSGVKDPFGYKWWIASHIKDMSRQELERLV